jgi:hypothetical protein
VAISAILVPDLFLSSRIIGWMRKPKLFSKRKFCLFNLRRSDPGALVTGHGVPFCFHSVSGKRIMFLAREFLGHGASIGASFKQRTSNLDLSPVSGCFRQSLDVDIFLNAYRGSGLIRKSKLLYR